MFLSNNEAKEYFLWNFWLIGQNFGRTDTNEISKLGKILGENSKNLNCF
jgi:hypothetical protein